MYQLLSEIYEIFTINKWLLHDGLIAIIENVTQFYIANAIYFG